VAAADDQALRAALRHIAVDRPRRGYRRAHHELRREGWEVNRKRVARLWREEGLRVAPERKRRPAGEVLAARDVTARASATARSEVSVRLAATRPEAAIPDSNGLPVPTVAVLVVRLLQRIQ